MRKDEFMKQKVIDVPQIRGAMEELMRWQRDRAEFNARVADEEEFYRLRVKPKAHRGESGEQFAPTSAWMLNTILQKHADLMEHIPSASCLAREPDDEAQAKALSAILPVLLSRSRFEQTYSDNMWCKLKHGVCAFGVFWNGALDRGIGDVDLRRIELMNLYWQPGVRDIQNSRAVYLVDRVEASALRAAFPDYDGKGAVSDFPGLVSAEQGAPEQVVVVDWYYKKRTPEGKTVLHYCKFAGDSVLFSSENEEAYEQGWYAHGQYPFVLDVLYPIEGEALGFGIIALARDPQLYIDRMDRNLLEYMDWATRVRFFCKKNTGINEQDFTDLTRRIVEVEGDLDEERLRQIRVDDLDAFWLQLKNAKIDELKETTANRDVLQGATDGGVIAASAIAALQEAGNKTVRDIVAASYRAFERVVELMIECMRQFYGEERFFRILGKNGEYGYFAWSNKEIVESCRGLTPDGKELWGMPLFDIDVRAVKKDPYTRISQNELLKDLYALGVFAPENAAAASILLSAMDFAGIERVREQVEHQGSLAGEIATPFVPKGSVAKSEVLDHTTLLKRARERAEKLRESAEEVAR